MLVQERTVAPVTAESKTTLHLLAGLPAEWIGKPGEVVSVDRTPTTLGTVVSLKLTRTSATTLRLEFEPGARTTDTFVHVPLIGGSLLVEVTMDGHPIAMSAVSTSASGQQAIVAVPGISHHASFDFTLAPASAAGAAR